ncbi:hypothetical protein GCM10010123_37280 [Pilimelia anulata]|uniref:Uncharacterized protein n=1 Tax=Pilimelia anulata TaxID=53371 RepID=A0A8J3BFL3_9ACTN|nr:hypothetical protein GCM10010123_37280 [Pilimelia anulata]
MLRTGDRLLLHEGEYRRGRDLIAVEILAVGALRLDGSGYWLPVKCARTTPHAPPEVRFIEIRSASIPLARSRAATAPK